MSSPGPSVHQVVRSVLMHPVTLEPLDGAEPNMEDGFFDASVGEHSSKNLAELDFAKNEYTEPDGQNYVERLPHMSHPSIGDDDIVVDIGCGPRSFLDGLPGHHVFVDDLMGSYVRDLGATFDGCAINARSELLPFASDSISVIYSVNMIDHVDDVPETMFELHRVLRPDGVLVLQTYFNSHPLLHSEPGVIDRYAFDTLISPYFSVQNLRTHQVESPEISSYYTMGIMTCELRKDDVATPRVDRSAYAHAGFLGPQSHISECLDDVRESRWDSARGHIDALAEREHYEFHAILLEAKLAIALDELADANDWIRQAREHRRGQRNPYARIAIKELEIERGRKGNERGIEVRTARIAELQNAIRQRDERNAELQNAIRQRDERNAELQKAVKGRDARIEKLMTSIHKQTE